MISFSKKPAPPALPTVVDGNRFDEVRENAAEIRRKASLEERRRIALKSETDKPVG